MTQARILLIEDDTFTGRMMELQFSKHDYEVTLAVNGQQAIDHIDKGTFDLVLSDVMMPGISGLDVLRHIRKTHDKRNLPVILLTALDNAASILQGFELGVNDFMGKTSEFRIVLAKVNHHLEVKRLYQEREPVTESMVRVGRDGLWNWNYAQESIHYSSRWKAILGYAAEEIGSSPEEWFSRVNPEDLGTMKAELDAHLQRKRSLFEANYRMQGKHGEVWVHGFGVAMFNKEGQPIRMLGCMTPLGELGELKNRLGEAVRGLQQSLDRLPMDDATRGILQSQIEALQQTI